jgi:hypothetical protein
MAASQRRGGDLVDQSLVNLHGEGDLVKQGWRMAVATRAHVWHSKGSTLPFFSDRDSLGSQHPSLQTVGEPVKPAAKGRRKKGGELMQCVL